MSKRAESETAITAITPHWTGSLTTRSAASGTLPGMLGLRPGRLVRFCSNHRAPVREADLAVDGVEVRERESRKTAQPPTRHPSPLTATSIKDELQNGTSQTPGCRVKTLSGPGIRKW